MRRGETFALFGGPWIVLSSCGRARRRGAKRETEDWHPCGMWDMGYGIWDMSWKDKQNAASVVIV
jgi:hypothetical protein